MAEAKREKVEPLSGTLFGGGVGPGEGVGPGGRVGAGVEVGVGVEWGVGVGVDW